MATGKIVQVIGTVVDVEFSPDDMPAVFNALETKIDDSRLVLEVEQHIGNGWVRCLAIDPNNEFFASGGADRTIKLWDLVSGQLKVS